MFVTDGILIFKGRDGYTSNLKILLLHLEFI